jgi:cyclic pyranopterin phosphate synthase
VRMSAVHRWIGSRVGRRGAEVLLTLEWQLRATRARLVHGDPDPITDVNVEINTNCNRRCAYCPNSIHDRSLPENARYMALATFETVVGQLRDLRFDGRFSPHFFGEPLLDNRLCDLVAIARRQLPRATIDIYTNGDLLTVEQYVRLCAAGASGFVITRHVPEKGRAVGGLLAWLDEHPGSRVPIELVTIDLATPLYNRGGEVDVPVLQIPRCRIPDNPLVIDYQGDVVLCCNDYHGSVVLGNVLETPLIEIWKSPNYRGLRRNLRRGHFTLPICLRCAGLEPAGVAAHVNARDSRHLSI